MLGLPNELRKGQWLRQRLNLRLDDNELLLGVLHFIGLLIARSNFWLRARSMAATPSSPSELLPIHAAHPADSPRATSNACRRICRRPTGRARASFAWPKLSTRALEGLARSQKGLMRLVRSHDTSCIDLFHNNCPTQ